MANFLVQGKLSIICNKNNKDRKIIHQYLDDKVKKASFYINCLPSESKYSLVICKWCDKNTIINPDNYIEDGGNGRYDYYWVDCRRCKCSFKFEPFYDYRDRNCIYQNNAIVLGLYMKGYNEPNHARGQYLKISNEAYLEAMCNSNMCYMDEPSKKLNKKQLAKYINDQMCMLFTERQKQITNKQINK